MSVTQEPQQQMGSSSGWNDHSDSAPLDALGSV